MIYLAKAVICCAICTLPMSFANAKTANSQAHQSTVGINIAESMNLIQIASRRGGQYGRHRSYGNSNSYRIGGSSRSYQGAGTYRNKTAYKARYGPHKRAYRHHGKRWTYSKNLKRYKYPTTRYYQIPYQRPHHYGNPSYNRPYHGSYKTYVRPVRQGYRYYGGRYWMRYGGSIPGSAAVLYYVQGQPTYSCLASYNNYEYSGLKYANGPCVIEYMGKRIGISNYYIQTEY